MVEVTSILMPGPELLRALNSALHEMVRSPEPSSTLLKDMLLLRGLRDDIESRITAPSDDDPMADLAHDPAFQRIMTATGFTDRQMVFAEEHRQRIAARTGLTPREVAAALAKDYSARMVRAGLDPDHIARKIYAAATANNPDLAQDIMREAREAVDRAEGKA